MVEVVNCHEHIWFNWNISHTCTTRMTTITSSAQQSDHKYWQWVPTINVQQIWNFLISQLTPVAHVYLYRAIKVPTRYNDDDDDDEMRIHRLKGDIMKTTWIPDPDRTDSCSRARDQIWIRTWPACTTSPDHLKAKTEVCITFTLHGNITQVPHV